MTPHPSNFVTSPPPHKQGPFIRLKLTSSHVILGNPLPFAAAFGGNGKIIGKKTLQFDAPAPGVNPMAVSGVAHVDLDSAEGAPKWVGTKWVENN